MQTGDHIEVRNLDPDFNVGELRVKWHTYNPEWFSIISMDGKKFCTVNVLCIELLKLINHNIGLSNT
jgi:hypothetical protein